MLKRFQEKPPVFDEQLELQRIRDRAQKCAHVFRVTLRTLTNGITVYVEQCQKCGQGRNVKASTLSDFQKKSAACYQKNKQSEYWSNFYEEERRVRDAANNRWWSWYNRYLQSDIWKERRRLVFARSNGMCEACGTEKATQVHHKTYEHVGFEPLFELAAVCVSCHEIITQSDRQEGIALPDDDDAFDFVA